MSISRENRIRIVLLLVALLIGISIKPLPVFAAFANSKAVTASAITAATLQPPTAINTVSSGQVVNCQVRITWTNPSVTPTNWVIQRYRGSSTNGSPKTIDGSLNSFVDSSGLSVYTSYTWRIYGTVGTQWTSTTVTSGSEYIGLFCT